MKPSPFHSAITFYQISGSAVTADLQTANLGDIRVANKSSHYHCFPDQFVWLEPVVDWAAIFLLLGYFGTEVVQSAHLPNQ